MSCYLAAATTPQSNKTYLILLRLVGKNIQMLGSSYIRLVKEIKTGGCFNHLYNILGENNKIFCAIDKNAELRLSNNLLQMKSQVIDDAWYEVLEILD